MKKNYKRILKANNAVDPAAPASRWGKGVPGKGGATLNSAIPERKPKQEAKEKMEGKQNA